MNTDNDCEDDVEDESNVPEGFESQFLASWKGWDQCGDFDLQFYNAVTSVDVGTYGKGTTFGVVTCTLSARGGVVEFYKDINDPAPVMTKKLKITLE